MKSLSAGTGNSASSPHTPTSGIVATALRKEFGLLKRPVIDNIDVTIPAGQFVSITGRSGSGKSTLLYLLSSLDQPTAGRVDIDGRDIHGMESEDVHRFRNIELGFVFQFHYLLPELSALENVLMPAMKTHAVEEKTPQALELLESFEVAHVAEKRPTQMSGGEMQRVAIARSLIMNPRYLFADEPTGNLDLANGQMVLDIFQKVNEDRDTTILMVTHEPDFASLAQRKIVLVDGHIDSDN